MELKNISVIGAGLMGSGIAQVFANSGFKVSVRSRRGKDGNMILLKSLRKAIDRKIITNNQAASVIERIKYTQSLREAVKSADLVIEAVVEDLSVKREVLKETSFCCPQIAIIASNTSSLSISSISETVDRPERVIGMHFFNPPSIMKLVEVVQSPLTSNDIVSSVISVSEKIGKIPLVVKDSPGFVVNRILMPAINSAAFLLREKVASAETIDLAMKLGANHHMGPLATADLIGIDVCLNIMKELNDKLGDSGFKICPLLEELVTEGNLGRKTEKGFFEYHK